MQRRVVYVGTAQDVERIAARNATPVKSADNGDSPLAGLLMIEIRRIERWTRMTDLQACVLEWNLRGFTEEEIAALRDTTTEAVAAVLHRARQKCLTYPHRGLLTVLVEECGWEEVQELLSER